MPLAEGLYDKCKRGDPKAQRELYDLFKNRLMGLCRRYTRTREEAEDVLQESFIKIFTRFQQVSSADKIEGWVKSVAVRTAIDHYHKHKKEKDLYGNEDASLLQIEAVSIDHISDEYLLTLINHLPGKCRMVFNLFEVEGYSHLEIAAIMDITESTSRSQLHYAKSLLKEKLKAPQQMLPAQTIMKDLQEDNLFGSIRDRLGRYEEAPSEELWKKIAKKKRDKVWPLFLEPIGVILIGTMLFFPSDREVTTNKLTSERSGAVTKSEVRIETADVDQPKQQVQILEQLQAPDSKLETINLQPEASNPQPETRNLKQETKPDSASILIVESDSSSIHEVIPPYKKPKSRYQLYLSVTPSLSFQKMIPGSNDEIIIQGFASRSPLSMKRFGFGIDAGFQKEINRFFEFYGGISFYRQQQQLTYLYYDREAEVNRIGESWTFEINRTQHTRTFDYTMTNLGVSAGLLVTIKGDKLKQKLGAGLMYSYNFKNANYVTYKLLYRSELTINDHASWFIEPNFIYSFVSKEKLSEPFTLKPYRVGITTGLLYRF